MQLGIDQGGFIYETFGTGHFAPVVPGPLLSQATLFESPADWSRLPPRSRFDGTDPLIFREDHFDPVTRTRRGRLYEARKSTQPNTEYVNAGIQVGNPTLRQLPLFVYQAPWALIAEQPGLEGRTLALGNNVFATAWRIVGVEMVGAGDVLLTLRALSAFGIIPELAVDKVPAAALPEIQVALRALADAAFRESPNAIIDRCRNALMVVIASWLAERDGTASQYGELSQLREKLTKAEKLLAANATATVALLHARTKPNVQREKGVSPPVDEDAMLAMHEVGAVLRELGWARRPVDGRP